MWIQVTLTCGMIFVCQTGVWVSQKLLISWDFHAQESLEFAENGAKNKNTSSEQQFCRQKHVLLMREVSGEGPVDCRSWEEGDGNANNRTLQQWYAKEHLWTHNVSNLKANKYSAAVA